MARKRRNGRVDWKSAPDVKKQVDGIVDTLNLDFVQKKSLFCVRSHNSSSRAYARIWGLSKVWQMTLKEDPSYVIEVLSEHFDKLPDSQKSEVLIHELAHIPKNFSGSLLPHIRRGKRSFHNRVKDLIVQYKRVK